METLCVISSLYVLLQREEAWSRSKSWLEEGSVCILNSQEGKILKEKNTLSKQNENRNRRELIEGESRKSSTTWICFITQH